MQNANHQNLVGFIWNIANKLRGPYRPPQYRRVMLPLIVLRRFDLVLAENKQKVLAEKKRLEDKKITGPALEKALSRIAATDRKQELFNTSGFTFEKLLGDAPNIAGNLIAYIQGFSPRARDIFDKFEFETEIAKLDEANRLFLIIKEFCSPDIDLSPKRLTNLQMGYLFEELVRKFNEQANEEAGDHFTPREVIRLMVQLLFTGEEGIYEKGIYRSVYDPTAGTGGMLSESEKYICGDGAVTGLNPDAHIELFGQEYNPESYAICCSDLLIKDEPIDNLIYGDTLGIKDAKNKTNGFVPHDGHPEKKFHYMLANPPFGVEWKPEEDFVREEYEDQGFSGRFGAGLPRINDGSLLFLQHMISKMHNPPKLKGDGSKIAIVFNGSPLFTGDAGSGESNIRRWIIERDMLDAVVALPDAVRALTDHAQAHGSGHNYLIQHSAGSGKSNSIAWLAHRLSSLHDANDEKIFHSVVVITDRRVLDQQLQDTIYQFEHKLGVVQKIDEDTQQLAKALSDGVPIIISTIQKFPFITQAIRTMEANGKTVAISTAGRRFAVIVDEAHSSQSGETAMELRKILNKDGIESAIAEQLLDFDDEALSEEAKKSLLREQLKRAKQPNLSFFAFTATPKFKTLCVFNEPGPDGKAPFHHYSMRQAIEEGFIHDVLANYTCYKRYYKLIQKIEDDHEVPRRKAARALARFVEFHD